MITFVFDFITSKDFLCGLAGVCHSASNPCRWIEIFGFITNEDFLRGLAHVGHIARKPVVGLRSG